MLLRLFLTVLFQSFLLILFFTVSDALLAYHVILSPVSQISSDIIYSATLFEISSNSDILELTLFFLIHKKIAMFCLFLLFIIILILLEIFLIVNHCFTANHAMKKETSHRNTLLHITLVGTSLLLLLLTPFAAAKSLEYHISKAARSLFPLMAVLMKEWPESSVSHLELGRIIPDKDKNRMIFENSKITKTKFPPALPFVYANKNHDILGAYLLLHEENWLVFSQNPITDKRYRPLYTREYDDKKIMYCYHTSYDHLELLMSPTPPE